jgi:hypothetical protein
VANFLPNTTEHQDPIELPAREPASPNTYITLSRNRSKRLGDVGGDEEQSQGEYDDKKSYFFNGLRKGNRLISVATRRKTSPA